jgi:hypothetical protein
MTDTPRFTAAQIIQKADYLYAVLRQCAETERQREAQTCQSCAVADRPKHGMRYCNALDTMVPLTVHGRPFSCAGWQAKERVRR